jgi:Ca-activated chloride channel homolog
VKVLTAAAILTIIATLAPSAQSRGPQLAEPVFRSGASLVALNVTVTDAAKRYVTGLTANDFAIYENGVQQDVRFFESTSVPIDLIILIDTSSSMRPRMDTVHKAALGFLSTLRAGDRGAVVTFNDGVDVLKPLTDDRASLEEAVRQTVARGGTALNNALYVAIKQFGRQAVSTGEIRRQAIAVLSDGADTASVISYDDVLDLARASGVNVYPIALEAPTTAPDPMAGDRSQTHYLLRQLARETGAQAFFPAGITNLASVYDDIARELSSQYSLAYAPTDTRPDGQFRRIAIRMTSRTDLRPRARTGYVINFSSVMH